MVEIQNRGDINLDISLLVKRAQKGDKEAFSDLIKNTRNDMFKVDMGILKNEEDLEVILIDVNEIYDMPKELNKELNFSS